MALSDDAWMCGYCGQHFVIPDLARRHEAKHEAGEIE